MASVGGIKAGRAFIVIDAVDKTGKVMRAVGARMRAFGDKISGLGRDMMMKAFGGALPIAGALSVFYSFDDAMRKVQARSHGTAKEMIALREQARALGRDTSNTAVEIANLQALLGQLGFKRSTLKEMTPHVRNLARGAGTGDTKTDIDLSSKLVGGTIRAFKMEASESGRVADVFTTAVNSSNFTLQKLTDSMANAGPVAEFYQVSLEDTVATLGQMVNLNVEASTAGVAFRNMLLKASNAGKAAKFNEMLADMAGVNVAFKDANQNLRPMSDVLNEIGQAMDGLGTAQQGQLLTELFGLRTIVGASAVANTQEMFKALQEGLMNAEGAAKRTAETMDKGLGGTFRRIKSAVVDLGLEIGEQLSPVIMGLEKTITDTIKATSAWMKENQDLLTMYTLAVAGTAALGLSFIMLGAAIKLAALAFVPFKIITSVTSMFLNLGMAIIRVSGIMLLFAGKIIFAVIKAMAMLVLYVVKAMTIIAAAMLGPGVNAIAYLIGYFGAMVVSAAITTAKTAAMFLAMLAQMLAATAIWAVDMLVLLSATWAGLITAILLVVIAVELLGLAFWRLSQKSSNNLGPVIKRTETLEKKLGNLGASLQKGFIAVFNPIANYLGQVWDMITTGFGNAVSFIIERATEIGATLGTTFGGITAAMQLGDTQAAWEIFVSGLTVAWFQFADAVIDVWDSVIKFFVAAWSGALQWFKTGLRTAQNAATEKTMSMYERVVKGEGNVAERMIIGTMLTGSGTSIKELQEIYKDDKRRGNAIMKRQREERKKEFGSDVAGYESDTVETITKLEEDRIAANKKREEDIATRKEALETQVTDIKKKAAEQEEKRQAELDNMKKESEAAQEEAKKLIPALAGGGGAGPLEGLEKGSMEAAKQFLKNQGANQLLKVNEEQRDIQEDTLDNIIEMNNKTLGIDFV